MEILQVAAEAAQEAGERVARLEGELEVLRQELSRSGSNASACRGGSRAATAGSIARSSEPTKAKKPDQRAHPATPCGAYRTRCREVTLFGGSSAGPALLRSRVRP